MTNGVATATEGKMSRVTNQRVSRQSDLYHSSIMVSNSVLNSPAQDVLIFLDTCVEGRTYRISEG